MRLLSGGVVVCPVSHFVEERCVVLQSNPFVPGLEDQQLKRDIDPMVFRASLPKRRVRRRVRDFPSGKAEREPDAFYQGRLTGVCYVEEAGLMLRVQFDVISLQDFPV